MKVKGTFPVRWKPQDGAPGDSVTILSQSVKYAKHTSGTVKPTSGWGTSIPTVENGLYLWTWTHIVYSDGNSTDMYSVSRMGVDGKGIKSSVVTYCQQATSVNPDTIAEASWGAFPSDLIDGYWLYTRTVVTYSDGGTAKSYSVSQVGVGSYYAGTEEWYALSDSQTIAPTGFISKGQYGKDADITPTGDWKQERPTANASTPYIWNFSISHDSRDNAYVTDVICIGNFAKGISSIVETYAISAEGAAPSGKKYPNDIAETDWTDEAHSAAPNSEKRYQWNKTETTYNDGTKEYHYHVSAVCGLDGKGAVYIDLDNDNDSMLYDGAGNLVSGAVTSNIVLYANGVKVASQPTFSIKERSSGITDASISGAVLTVNGCTANSGYVIVKCTYQDTEYTARFTAKRLVGTDKYEIILSHNAITHNTDTDVLSASSVSVSVYRTAQNGTRTQVTSLSTYGLTLKCYPNGLSVNQLTPTYSGGSASFDINRDWDSVDVVLIKAGKEVDRESVPIGKVKNGPQGVGAMRLDLDNENDTMLYDGSNTTCLSGNVTSQATLYQGTSKIESGITWSCNTTNCTATISTSGKVTVTAMSSSSGSVTVNAQYGGETYTALLTLKKIRGNDKYELVCNPNAVTYNSDTDVLSSSTVNVQVYKTDASGTRSNISSLPSGFYLTLSGGTLTRAYSGGYATVSVKKTASELTITLIGNSVTQDSETIPICKVENGEGVPGANAKSIYKNSFEKPAIPTGSSPSGWSNDIVEQTPISVQHQGDWVKDAEGWHVAPQIGNSQTSIQTIQFITTKANQSVYYRVKVNFAHDDDVFVGKLDATSPKTNYNNRLYGLNKDTGDVFINVPTAGVHFICIVYYRVSSTPTAEIGYYAKYKLGVMPTWKADAKTYNDDGTVATWSAPYKVSEEQGDEHVRTRPNLLYQTSFISTQMDKWTVKGGQTSTGLDGQSSYYGTNNDTSTYKELLKQLVYDTDNPNSFLLKNETWYTLSFWAKTTSAATSSKLATYLYPSCASNEQSTYTYIDTGSALYVDGEKRSVTNSSDNGVQWKLTEQWTRHWMAFKTRNTLPNAKQQLLFRLLAGAGTVYVCMPKLEEGIGATAWCTNDKDIIDRSAGENGFPNDRGVWVNSPSTPYKWDDKTRDYVSWENANGEFKKYFVRTKGMTVPNGHEPAADGTSYWEEGSIVQTVITNTAVITNALIGGFQTSNNIFRSVNGSLILDGLNGLIKMFHDGGYSWQVLPDGRQVLGVYTDDNDKGRHIQLDPESQEVRIYDDSGTCVTNINGETINSFDNIFGTTKGTLTLTGNNSSKSINNYTKSKDDSLWKTTNETTNEVVIGAFETLGGTRLSVRGTIVATGNTTVTLGSDWKDDTGGSGSIIISPGGQDLDGNLTIHNYASVTVLVKTYSDSTKKTLLQNKQLTTINTNGGGEKSTAFNISVDLSIGYHTLIVKYTLSCPGFQSHDGSASARWNISSAEYSNDIYLSRLFANGVVYGSSVNNFFTAMNIDGRMLVKAATINKNNYLCGFELSNKGLNTLYREQQMKTTVCLFFGYAYYNTSTGTISWSNVSRGVHTDSDNGTNPTLTKAVTAGQYTIGFPSTWQNMGITAASIFVTAIGVDSGTVVTVSSLTATGCTIRTSSGTTAAHKSFRVKIEFMIP